MKVADLGYFESIKTGWKLARNNISMFDLNLKASNIVAYIIAYTYGSETSYACDPSDNLRRMLGQKQPDETIIDLVDDECYDNQYTDE